MLPTFLGLGAQRAGTTWLYRCLAEHPQVFMTAKKEVYFFHLNYDRGMSWYQDLFADAGSALARGEITPDYMYREQALDRIANDLPDVRVIVMLRDPVERAISAIALHPDRYKGLSLRDTFEKFPDLIERGLYTLHLKKIYEYIDPQRVLILFYDDISLAPGRMLDQVFEFIGVDKGVRPPSMGTRVNRVIYPGAQGLIQRIGLGWSIEFVKRTPIGGWIRRNNAYSRKASGTATEDDLRWMAEYFREDVEKLARQTGRSLDHWLD